MFNLKLMAEVLERLGGVPRTIVCFNNPRFPHSSAALEDMCYDILSRLTAMERGKDKATKGVYGYVSIF